MTSLLSPSVGQRSAVGHRHRRPLWLAAPVAGVLAAVGALLVLDVLTLAGWYLADAGSHGAPRDALRVGALGWLTAHGSGIHVGGVAVTVIPWGLTLFCAWVVWKVGHRLGDAISGHGPDADRIADGERDWTVPIATALFSGGYAGTAALLARLVGDAATGLSGLRTLLGALLIAGVLGGLAIATGSGRLPVWAATLPRGVSATVATAVSVLRLYFLVAMLALAVALAVDWAAAANVMSQLQTSPAGTVSMTTASLALLPNAAAFSGCYLLGAGFTVGSGTLVTPTVVVLGPLPLFPLLAALPDAGTPPAWTPYLLGVPPLVAAVAAVRTQRRHPTTRWGQGALHGCAGGVLAAVAFALLASVAGGAVGPGRMQQVAPHASSALVYALVAFGFGGLVGGLIGTSWQRRRAAMSTAD